ncbi:geranylgeranyl pyrophosphate synthase [Anaerolinea thermolimosa]|uniref:polyprenyl synthetase family protein n=1 Tax=Anaerolinea thermolimosa TaxID=229919 RepID=UPI0007851B0A|nr:polyprenyl synthetase family protein [Anaerolinea thermolimosa]GAP06574.1 geranylgeranyl pyrophosphate synthase [Anaerolinea thermolimosa]
MNTTIPFIVPVQDDIQAVEALMRAQADDHHPDLRSALHLLLSAGGKRIRPALTVLIGKMLHADRESLLSLAAAIELLHTATLVHDDLIDNSLLRRGMPTLNSRWSPGATVLTGDFIFAKAANMAAQTNSIPVMKIFSHTLSVIVNGEISQLFSTRCKADRESYYFRIYSKTASLFETSAKAAALISPVDQSIVEQMGQFGYNIGMAFQIIDDILDFVSQEDALGKPVGGDLRQGIITLPAILFAETFPDHPAAQRLLNGECIQEEDRLENLIEEIRRSEAISLSYREAVRFIENGLCQLRNLPECEERFALEELAHYIVRREL